MINPERGRLPTLVVLLIRWFLGYVMLKAGLAKLQGGFIATRGVKAHIEQALASGAPFGFYRGFLQRTVLGHADLFSYLVVAGELMVGAFLIAGLLTRWAGMVGLFLMINYALTSGQLLSASPPVAFGLLFLVVATTHTGRVLGLDRFLEGKVPDWLI